MQKLKKAIIISIIAGLTLPSLATASDDDDKQHKKEEQADSVWKGSNAQLGITANTGNTRTVDVNTGLNINYAQQYWKNQFQFTTQLQKNSGDTTKEKYFAQNQTNFNLGDSHNQFLFINGNATIDKLSPYTYQLVFSSGYGLDLIKNDIFKWTVQAGPGFRTNKNREDNSRESKYATTAQTTIDWKMTPTVDLSETASAVWGQPSNYYRSVTAFTNKITGNIATSVTFIVDHYDRIPPSSDKLFKTDTTTAISLVYNFG